MQRILTTLPGVIILEPQVFCDHRGYFMETYSVSTFSQLGIEQSFVQENQSFTAQKGTLRGLHFQNNSMAQAKLVRVTQGTVFYVTVILEKALHIIANGWPSSFLRKISKCSSSPKDLHMGF